MPTGRSRSVRRDDEPVRGDAWSGRERDPLPDVTDEAAHDWLWSRGVQWSRLPHEINDARVLAVLDSHPWEWLPTMNEPGIRSVLNSSLRADRTTRFKPRVLTPVLVAELRERYNDGEEAKDLAVEVHAPIRSIWRAILGITWTSVTDPPPCIRR